MRIPDLERQIEAHEFFYMSHCKNCGEHIAMHTKRIADSTLYCHPAPGRPPRGFFQSMAGS